MIDRTIESMTEVEEESLFNAPSSDETLSKKISKKKSWFVCTVLVLVISATAVGLVIHFARTSKTSKSEPDVKNAVLVLSTYSSSNLPMVIQLPNSVVPMVHWSNGIGLNGIGLNGESVL